MCGQPHGAVFAADVGAGLRVRATKAEIATAPARVTANSRNRIRPQGRAMPGRDPEARTPRMAPVTSTLSAMGSRMAPQRVVAFQRRAR